MLKTRIIPVLLLREQSLVKTVNFKKFTYIGDPCNTVRIFNELEADELILLGISNTIRGKQPAFELLKEIASECFMPLGYGGGIKSLEHARMLFNIGYEKVVINSYACESPEIVTELASCFGSQAVVGSVDYRRSLFGGVSVYTNSGTKRIGKTPVEWAQELEHLGAGEILLTSIEREGRWEGFDIDTIEKVASSVNVPVIAHGGAGCVADVENVLQHAGIQAVALGSLVVYQKKDMGVLVNFPFTNLDGDNLYNGPSLGWKLSRYT